MANITGTNGKDTLNGSNSKDTIFALDDDDVVGGGGGNDTIDGGAGWDTLYGGTGNDVLLGGPGQNHLYGGAGHDLIGLDDASRHVFSADSGDIIFGDSFNSYTLPGGHPQGHDPAAPSQLGDDTIYGTGGADIILGDNNDDPLANYGGHDVIFAGNGADIVDGNGGNDFIAGEGGDDVMWGWEGKDTLIGGDGNDSLIGGAAADMLDGGAGDDRFIYYGVSDSAGSKIDTITAFESGFNYASGDKIDIALLDGLADSIHWSGTAATSHGAWYESVAGGVRLLVDVTGDAVADFRTFVQGVSSLKHSDILGVINNAPLLIGEVNNAGDPVVEAGGADPGDSTASGTLPMGPDTDGDALLVANAGTHEGTYGSLELTIDGDWTYTLDNSKPATEALVTGEIVTDNFEFALTDGLLTSNSIPIVITIAGTTDGGGGLPPDPVPIIIIPEESLSTPTITVSTDFFIA